MRLYYDVDGKGAIEQLTSTIFFVVLGVTSGLFAVGLIVAPQIAAALSIPSYAGTLRLVLFNTFVIAFYFIPFHLLRIQNRSRDFALLTFLRSAATLGLRLIFVAGLHLGILGVVLADLAVTTVFTVILSRLVAPLLGLTFSTTVLRHALRLGLPLLPHKLAQHVMGLSDRYFLSVLATLHDVGVYSLGAGLGAGLKLFLGAFQYAWTPFVFETMEAPNAKDVFRAMSTYVLATVVLLAAVLSGVAPDLLRLLTTPMFHGASRVVPLIALAVVFQTFYQVTSIGLGIKKRPEYLLIATGAAALVSVIANLVLIPRFGVVGAGAANALSYAVMAAVAMRFAQRHYFIRHDWARLARIVLAGLASYSATAWLVPRSLPPLVGILLCGVLAAMLYAGLLFMTGFFRARELELVRELAGRLISRPSTFPQPAQALEQEPNRSETQIP